MAENKTLEHLPEVRAAVAALSPEDRELLAAVQSDEWNHERPAEPEKALHPGMAGTGQEGMCGEKQGAAP